MIRFLPFLIIIAATAVPMFIIIQSQVRLDQAPPTEQTKTASQAVSTPGPSGAAGPAPHRSAILSLRYEPFKNQVVLENTAYATTSAPTPAQEPLQREGKFVLKIEHRTATGSADYVTWVSFNAIKQLWDAAENPVHTVTATVPYEPASTVIVNEPQAHREYTRFLLP